MITDSPEISSSIPQKFQAFYELFTEFNQGAAELHGNLPVHDEASRAVYNSLSRIMAFSDQLNILVSLMREDVRLIDELTTDPVKPTWIAQVDPGFYDWLRASRAAAPGVN
ncbi:MAG TPA: hypothetical protein VGJ21_05180 [Terracidiphilus sp.]|jgi:hypothetical protein